MQSCDEIEEKMMYSILQKDPKELIYIGLSMWTYWQKPYKTEYKVTEIIKMMIYIVTLISDLENPPK
jgi:KUP system potassium uptake protein